jgi:DNA repair ATPase RecN
MKNYPDEDMSGSLAEAANEIEELKKQIKLLQQRSSLADLSYEKRSALTRSIEAALRPLIHEDYAAKLQALQNRNAELMGVLARVSNAPDALKAALAVFDSKTPGEQ